jgi:hypothetical protein
MKKPLTLNFHSRNDKSGSDFRTKIDQRFPDQNRIAIFILKSDPEFIFSIAIAIPIKNRSGKTGDRFLFQIRFAIFRSKSDPVFLKYLSPLSPAEEPGPGARGGTPLPPTAPSRGTPCPPSRHPDSGRGFRHKIRLVPSIRSMPERGDTPTPSPHGREGSPPSGKNGEGGRYPPPQIRVSPAPSLAAYRNLRRGCRICRVPGNGKGCWIRPCGRGGHPGTSPPWGGGSVHSGKK